MQPLSAFIDTSSKRNLESASSGVESIEMSEDQDVFGDDEEGGEQDMADRSLLLKPKAKIGTEMLLTAMAPMFVMSASPFAG